jgi:hypothetical protein
MKLRVSRPRRARRFARLALLCAALVLLLGVVSPAGQAALPRPNTLLAASDHSVAADSFHLRVEIGRRAEAVREIVLYSVRCKADVSVRRLPLTPSGTLAATTRVAPRPSNRTKSATLFLNAQFLTPGILRGTFRIMNGACDTGLRPFEASRNRREGHAVPPPDIVNATPQQRAEAETLLARSKEAAAAIPSITAALQAGYVLHPGSQASPLFHATNCDTWFDDRVLDPSRPESLVYLNLGGGRLPVLLAFMFRVSAFHPPPALGGPIVRWHMHPGGPPTQMTHVWFTNRLESAYSSVSEPPLGELAHRLNPPPDAPVGAPPPPPPPAPRESEWLFRPGWCLGRGFGLTRTVRLGKRAFSKKRLSLASGTTIKWVWKGKTSHDLVADGSDRFRSLRKRSGSYKHRFMWLGRTRVACSVHPRMRLTIDVHR